jgi:peptidoglycan lytic transglycosylase
MWFWGLGFSSAGMGTGHAGLGEGAPKPASHASRLTAIALTATAITTCAAWPGFAEVPASFAERWWQPDRTAALAAIKAREVQYWLQYETAYPEPKAEKPRGYQLAARTESPAPGSGLTARSRYIEDGLASYYRNGDDGGTRTASGEAFDGRALTAAHPTLPFGTRVRVTNLASGRSVTVRINDRGPFVPGRVIDVSQAAAEELGMVGRGVTKVKLDVVQ